MIIFALSTTLFVTVCSHDYQLTINETAIEKLKDHLTPFFHDFILTQQIPAQTVTDIMDIDIANVSIANISQNEIIINLDSHQQEIHTTMNNIDLLFNQFRFEAYKTIIWKLSCIGYATPQLKDWNISFSIDIINI